MPIPGPGEVLLRVRAVSICPSDLRLYQDGHASGVVPDHPMIQGHEFAGVIEAHGPGVNEPALGTGVAVEPSWHCGACDSCQRGLTNLCRNIIFPSFPQRDGALAEYIAVPAFALTPLPEGMSFIHGALMEPLGVGLHAVRLAKLAEQDRIAILGAGAIGMAVLLMAQAQRTSRIAVVEPLAGRRRWPEELGASPVVASHTELLEGAGSLVGRVLWQVFSPVVASHTEPLEAAFEGDAVFECSGDPAAVQQAMELARPGGTVVVVGIPHPDEVTFDSKIPRRKELTIIFARRSRETLRECVELVRSRRVDLGGFATRRFTLEQTAEAMEATAARPEGMLRAVVEP